MFRSPEGKLVPDPARFPSGIPALADYVHKLGLKLGIYEDYGNLTCGGWISSYLHIYCRYIYLPRCGGYPGSLGHLQTDAETFASWGVDYVKLDGCYSEPKDMDTGYPEFGKYLRISVCIAVCISEVSASLGMYLNKTQRPMVYSCSWPAYQVFAGQETGDSDNTNSR